jgi:FixJ family two-component response regulator
MTADSRRPRKGVLGTKFGSGEEFLDSCDWKKFGMIASDISMNCLDGVEMVLKMRKRGYLGPVILMTGLNIDLSPFAKALQPYTLIKKPFKIQELIACMETGRDLACSGYGFTL